MCVVDTGVSSLSMNGTSVSLLAIEGIEEIGIWESMGDSNYSKRLNWAKLDIWVFHGFFDIWVDLEVMLGGRKSAKVIHWAEILSWIKSNCKVKSGVANF